MHDQITDLLPGLQPPETGERTPFCPEDHQLAAWFEQHIELVESSRMAWIPRAASASI